MSKALDNLLDIDAIDGISTLASAAIPSTNIGVTVEAYDADIVKAPAGVLPALDGSNLSGISSTPIGTPDLSCLTASSNEETNVTVTIDNHNVSLTYIIIVSGGTYVKSGADITWTLPVVTADTDHTISVFATDGTDTSLADSIIVNVLNIPAVSDQTLLYEGTTVTSEFTGTDPSYLDNVTTINNKLVASGNRVLDVNANVASSADIIEVGDTCILEDNYYTIDTVGTITGSVDILNIFSDNNCLAAYKFDNDITGLDGVNSGTLGAGTESYITGKFDNAFVFNGSTNIDTGITTATALSTECSVSFWIRDFTHGSYPGILGFGAWNFGFALGEPVLHIPGAMSTTNSAVIPAGTQDWYHIVIVNNTQGAAITTANCAIYIDKVSQAYGLSGSGSFSSSTNAMIGANNSATPENLIADIDQLRIFDRALTQTDVDTLFDESISKYSITATTPPIPSTILTAELVTKTAESTIITQDNGQTDFIELKTIEVKEEFSNIVDTSSSANTLITSTHLKTGDILKVSDGINTDDLTCGTVTPGTISFVDRTNPFVDNSLLAKYKFENNVLDALNTYNGTPANITYGSGQFGQAAVFNGSTSRIDFTAIPVGSSGTISFWFNITTSTTGIALADSSGTAANAIQVYDYRILAYLGGGAKSAVINYPSTVTGWHHITLTKTGVDVELYFDGVYAGTDTCDGGTMEFTRIGVRGDNVSYFNGSLDQIEIYNRVLTAKEISSLYTQSIASSSVDTSSITADITDITSSINPFGDGNLKAKYELNGTVLDTVTSTTTATPTNITYTTGNTGYYGDCAIYNDTTSKIVTPTLNMRSISCMCYFDSAQTASDAGNRYVYSSAFYNLYFRNSDGTTSGATISYVNGVLGANAVYDEWFHLAIVFPANYNTTHTLGNHITNLSGIGGKLDQIELYDRILTTDEIAILSAQTIDLSTTPILAYKQDARVQFNMGSGYKTITGRSDTITSSLGGSSLALNNIFDDGNTLATYTFDDNVNDLSTVYNAAVVGTTTYAGAKFNNGFSFNGSTHLSTTLPASTTITNNSSISVWVSSLTDVNLVRGIVDFGTSMFGLFMSVDGFAPMYGREGTVMAYCNTHYSSATPRHVVIVNNTQGANLSTSNVEVYIDKVKQTMLLSSSGAAVSATDMQIGINSTNNAKVTGTYDQLRIFDRALTQEDVNILFDENVSETEPITVTSTYSNHDDVTGGQTLQTRVKMDNENETVSKVGATIFKKA